MSGVDLGWLRDRPTLVTGAGGFVGAAVVRRLVALGARVRAWLGPAPAPGLQPPPAGVAVGYGDITDVAAIDRQLDGVACVYHLAGPPGAASSFAAPAAYLQVHATGTAAVLERCLARGIPRLVHVSSAEVYAPASAPAGAPVDEDHPRAPRSPYGIAKLAAELCLETCAPAGAGLVATIVRPFSIYGPGASPASLIGTLIAAVLRGESPALADLRPVRDYCFVDDAAEGIVRAGCRDGAGPRAYNLASGSGASVRAVAHAVLRAAGRTDLSIGERAADRPPGALTLALVGDPARARDELGFRAAIALDEGLRRTLDAARPGSA
ncbi:MAG TPA: NAD-dependent epimerase/dehydratase family protein [Kofleriaceae bacterium]|nr:NAD-dependent epimerase/dehydratase family protein [Kofleriaceae bacterium]